MGGRGTFASGKGVEYSYKTVGMIEGVKVLEGASPKYKGLPVEAHSSGAYIQLHPDGTFKMYREFDSDHYLIMEIAYHREPKLSGHYRPVLHIHDYTRNTLDDRTTRFLTEDEFNKYRIFFKGVIK